MGGVAVGNFNYLVTKLNKLQGKLKVLSSLLGDFNLYSNSVLPGEIFFSDTFNNLNKADIGSTLLDAEQCEVSQDEGIVLLPVDKNAQKDITITTTPTINSNSNGVVGNNQQVGVPFHGDINDILDGNADTWFEYERVLTVDDGLPLLLDITVDLGASTIVNFIRINPNNFGARTQIEILAIDTSSDGKTLLSIKDDIPSSGVGTQIEDNSFVLSPTTSKYAGQGFFTFTPRKARYIHFSFRQSTPYTIATATGDKYRYAIGIRDIGVVALPFKDAGEFISTSFTAPEEIKKLTVSSSQTPSGDSTLATIEHAVSPDNGITWFPVRPTSSTGTAGIAQTVPELLDFNGVEAGTINTSSPVLSLRYRASFKRNSDAFTDKNTELAISIADGQELFPLPATAPFTLGLQNTPIDGTLALIDPSYGKIGDPLNRIPLAIGTGNKLVTHLPLGAIPYTYSKSGLPASLVKTPNITVIVDGAKWTSGKLVSNLKNYRLYVSQSNPEDVNIEFGDGITGEAPGVGRVVSVVLENPELLQPSLDPDHLCTLQFHSAGDVARCSLQRIEPIKTTTITLVKGSNSCSLGYPFVYSGGLQISDTTVFGNNKTFVDGFSELASPGDWSGDFENGILYSFSPTDSTNDTTVTFSYLPSTVITNWSFIQSSDGTFDTISIADDSFKLNTITGQSVPAGVKYFNLLDLSIAKSTLVFSSGLVNEVAFVNGVDEFKTVATSAYSVNYLTGEVFSNTVTGADITASYQCSGYYLTYEIARVIDSSDWSFDKTSNQITITDREILRNLQIPASQKPSGAGGNKMYEVTYKYVSQTREDIEDLEPFYSPILKDYTLKILTKSSLL